MQVDRHAIKQPTNRANSPVYIVGFEDANSAVCSSMQDKLVRSRTHMHVSRSLLEHLFAIIDPIKPRNQLTDTCFQKNKTNINIYIYIEMN